MVREIAVRDRYRRRPHDRVDEPVRAVRQRAVIDPYVPGPEDRYAVAVRLTPVSIMRWAGPHVGLAAGHAVVDMDVVNDNIGDVLECYAGATGNVDVDASPVQGLEAVEDELLLEPYEHVSREGDPEGLCLDHCVAQSAWRGAHRVAVGGVRYHVYWTITTAQRIGAKADGAVG